ncbi:SCR-like 8 [Arabidopsis thaliana]|uniref:Defensin-like protein 250 n=1 Tax=Arabidopsis thaliana TaxID=3702 RepID=DF250_ARATH|nr:SCR-like 8 [Arabidopsis thaliana]P82627.1 RecName: Full=Defensin-like protein 250; AltName: Full=S locus cysteine-rich-like protein 8; Short=Protein SCRL8; Short=SCR-like protein 8; Flags: Precursor [Arabidopsis thaliana]AEE33756.1 SCR-like 8 [Arabidopsis thaliana]|eukprot:NP_001031212.1 SCR-like 8 [Arabidopsis thaliana]
MKLAAIFLVSCVLLSLLPSLTIAEKRPWCPTRKQIFDGSCNRTDYTQCFNDLRNTWDDIGDLCPTDCTCTPQPQNKRLCYCRYLPCPST